jgi:hypothetical protein
MKRDVKPLTWFTDCGICQVAVKTESIESAMANRKLHSEKFGYDLSHIWVYSDLIDLGIIFHYENGK